MSKNSDSALVDYRVRRGAISAYGRALKSSRILGWSLCLLALVLVVVLSGILVTLPGNSSRVTSTGLLLALLIVAAGFPLIWTLTNRNFIEPDLAFRKWLQQVCDGDLDARIEIPESHPHYKELHFHTQNLTLALMRLSTEMETVVESQTQSLEQQKKVRALLFQITADVVRETDSTEIIKVVCRRLASWWGRAIIYGYLVDELQARCITAIRIDSENDGHIRNMQITENVDVQDLVDEIAVVENSESDHPTEIRIPFFTGGTIAGMLLIKCHPLDSVSRDESERVLNTVSEQISLYLTKQLLAEQAQGARIISERTTLAAEIHDSLAQTLLAIRNQIALLKDRLGRDITNEFYRDIQLIENTINVANTEVRKLIHEYRSSSAEKTRVDALQQTIDRFRDASGMDVFFQCDNRSIRFSPDEESIAQRIVGESLVNAQKYSKAEVIRVYLHEDQNGVRTILIEDDGIGFSPGMLIKKTYGSVGTHESEHFGMRIMNERALSIGAVLNVESEPGEGTRVSLKLPPLLES